MAGGVAVGVPLREVDFALFPELSPREVDVASELELPPRVGDSSPCWEAPSRKKDFVSSSESPPREGDLVEFFLFIVLNELKKLNRVEKRTEYIYYSRTRPVSAIS